jgi:hypothetical protein
VRSFGVEFANEVIEASLLLRAVHAWRSSALLLEREMHALVTPVLLGISGLDALDRNPEPEPPDSEL